MLYFLLYSNKMETQNQTQNTDEVEKIYLAHASMVRKERLPDFRTFLRISLKPVEDDPELAHCQDLVLRATLEGLRAYDKRLDVQDAMDVVDSYHPSGYEGFTISRNIANLHKEGEKIREYLKNFS